MRNLLYKRTTSPKLLPVRIGLPSREHSSTPPLPNKSVVRTCYPSPPPPPYEADTSRFKPPPQLEPWPVSAILHPHLASHPSCECSKQRQSSAVWAVSSSGAATASSSSSAACSKHGGQVASCQSVKVACCLFSTRLPPQLSSPCLKLPTRPASNHHCPDIRKSQSLLVLQNALINGTSSTEVLSSVLRCRLCSLNIELNGSGHFKGREAPVIEIFQRSELL